MISPSGSSAIEASVLLLAESLILNPPENSISKADTRKLQVLSRTVVGQCVHLPNSWFSVMGSMYPGLHEMHIIPELKLDTAMTFAFGRLFVRLIDWTSETTFSRSSISSIWTFCWGVNKVIVIERFHHKVAQLI